MNQKINVFIPKDERVFADNFLNTYEPCVYQGTVESNKREIKKVKNRVCRFCNKNSQQVTFKTKPHLISKLLGSRNFFSVEECDECNSLFKSYESNLASYLGIYRTINSTINETKIPGFESGNRNIKIKNYAGIIHIKRSDINKDLEYDALKNELKFSIQTQSYTPELVYNAFLKMALSIMPKNEIKEYQFALKFLRDKTIYQSFKEIKQIQIVESNITYEFPIALLYKRKPQIESSKFPLHIFCLYVKNFMFQISFPLHDENLKRIQNLLTIKIAPYVLIGSSDNEEVSIRRSHDDLQSSQTNNLDNSLTMKFDVESLNNLIAFDGKTKSFIPVALKKDKNL